MKLSFNQKLALLAFTISFLALIVSVFESDNSSSEIEYIPVLELAENIKDKTELTLIDLQEKNDFDQFHIPTAKNISLSDIATYNFNSDAKVIIYSQEDSISERAYFSMKERGIDSVQVVRGGIQDWYSRVLYPRMPKTVSFENQEIAKKVKELSSYFGGRPEFVDEGNPLDYYQKKNSNQPIIESNMVRMRC